MKLNPIFAILFAVLILFSAALSAQVEGGSFSPGRGVVLEGQQMESELMDEPVHYAVYLPPGYREGTQRYPVVYLLHGYSDDETAWIQFGEVQRTANRAIAGREIPPMIIVMPDAKVTWYINDYRGKTPYEDMIFREFIPYVDSVYRTRPQKEFRAVAGLSMGGYGSLIWSLHHPDMFASCAAYSAGIFIDDEILRMDERRYDSWFSKIYGPSENNRLTGHWKKNSVLYLAETLPVEEIEKVRFYIDCGDDDFLYVGNSLLHIEMRKRGINHEYRVREGAHNWTYWRNHIIHGLRFIGDGFHR